MTGATIALRAARTQVCLRADAVALGGLALFVGILAAATWGTWGDLDSDTGYDLVAGARVADGELPYRDFTYYYGPLAPFLSGLAALLGGSGFVNATSPSAPPAETAQRECSVMAWRQRARRTSRRMSVPSVAPYVCGSTKL